MGAKLPVFLVRDPSNDYFPLSLGLLKARLMNCELADELQFFGNLNQRFDDILRTAAAFGPGVWLFSDYVWSMSRNLSLSAALKTLNPGNFIIHGGPSLPKYPEAFEALVKTHPSVDVGVRGEGEDILAAVFSGLLHSCDSVPDLEGVAGITWRTPQGDWLRNADARRSLDLSELPSPYLEGLFDRVSGSAWIVETNRGCPYRCVFCDWGSLTAQKIAKFEMQRVKDELTWGARRCLEVLFIADANFGIFERDLEIAEHIAWLFGKFGFPRECNVTFAKNAEDRVVEILRILTRAGVKVDGNLAVQTTDPRTLEAIGRSNLPAERYDRMIHEMVGQGIPPNSDLMVCLPGQTIESFKHDLQTFMDKDIGLLIHHTYVLPNSPMAHPEYRERWRLEIDEDGRVVSCASFSVEEGRQLVAMRNAYFLAEFYGFFRYLMRHLQWDRGIPCGEFLLALTESQGQWSELVHQPQLPHDFSLHATLRSAIARFHESDRGLYSEVKSWLLERFGLQADAALNTAFTANESVLPNPALSYPREVELPHDFVAYFQDHMRGEGGPLHSYGPGSLKVSL